MEQPILISWLNDYVFCPVSIYFHNLYGEGNKLSFQEPRQINGSAAHKNIDSGKYSTRADVVCGISVYCEKYKLSGKIDIFDIKKGELRERKKLIKTIYDGYIFQLYGQYFSLIEMGYAVRSLVLYSLDDNKKYAIKKPEDDPEMFKKFLDVINELNNLDISAFKQTNIEKCGNCIYEPLCGSSLLDSR